MLLLKCIQLLVGVLFFYLGFQLRVRHNYRVLHGFFGKRNYSGTGKGYARRVGRIYLFGGGINILVAVALFVFVRIPETAAVGTPHRVVTICFAAGVVGLFLTILVNEIFNLRRYKER